jgi:uncharacterized protein (TIGR03435 family)
MSTMRILAGFLVAFLTVAGAQTPLASPQFEVASIKASPPPRAGMVTSARGGPGTEDPTFFTCENYGLSGMIWMAFDLQDYQLSGPDWMPTTQFTVSAKIPPGTTRAQFRLMLQNLLIDRFKMTFHHEKRQVNGFALIVAKGGPKFKEYVEEPSSNDDTPLRPAPMEKDANGFPKLVRVKGFSMAIMNDRAALHSGGGTMEEFAQSVSNQLRLPVTDATGLTGKYDVTLSWVADNSPDAPAPNIFQAVQEQLGLKLESKKITVDVLVVDHIEKAPTEN